MSTICLQPNQGCNVFMNLASLKEAKLEPNKKLVEHLQGLLDEAKNGELIAYAVALQYRGEYWSHGYHLSHKKTSIVHMIGVLQMLVTQLCNRKMDET